MAKRFIDTGLFDDDWFMDLSKDAKILWLYFITKCDHAGMLKINEKLCKVQTDIKDLHGVIRQLGNRLVRVSEHLYFIPKYIDFQYPGFPNSKVRQQVSALEILKKHSLYSEEGLRVNKELPDSYEHDTDNEHKGGVGETPEKKKLTPQEKSFNFYTQEVERAKNFDGPIAENYVKLCNHICQGYKTGVWEFPYVLKIEKQISLDNFSKLFEKSGKNLESIISKIDSIQNKVKYHDQYSDLYRTISTWFDNDNSKHGHYHSSVTNN